MSGHCPKCGTYHEEDDDRVCGKCNDIDRLNRENADLDARLRRMHIDRDNFRAEATDLRARMADAEKARDEQAEAVRVLGAALAACNELRKKERTMTYTTYATKASAFGPLWYAVTNNPTAAAAVKEVGNA